MWVWGMSVCCVWERLGRLRGSESVQCVGEIGASFGGVSLCCVWEGLVWVWGSEYVLCVGQFGGGGGREFVLLVGEFGVCLGE